MARRRWVIAGIAAVAIGVVASVGTYFVVSKTEQKDEAIAPLTDRSVTPVCGFSGDLLSRLVADKPADSETAKLSGWPIGDDGSGTVVTLAVHGDTVTTVRALDSGAYRVAAHNTDGTVQSSFDYDFERGGEPAHNNGRPAVAPDGSVYAIDSFEGRRALVRFDSSGKRAGSWEVPTSDESKDHPLDLQDVVWVSDYEGEPALLIGEGERTVHAFRTDGTSLGEVSGVSTDIVNAVGNSTVAGLRSTDDADVIQLTVTDASTGAVSLQVSSRTTAADYGQSETPFLDAMTSVLPGPGGDGHLLVQPGKGVEWVSSIGIRRAMWLSSQDEWAISRQANAVRSGDASWFVIETEGEQQVLRVSDDRLRERLTEPVPTDAATSEDLAQLGVGIGAVTAQPFNHFDHGVTPAATIRFEKDWGELRDGEPAKGLEIRYTVRGDPTIADPVVQDEATVAVAVGGGDKPLKLPAPRPGPYEVDISLVQGDTDAVLAGTCLRYSVGAEGADLNLDTLAEGADWGGAGPQRGVQLADRLGIGSHRIQLDFGALVPDPSRQPTAAGIDWAALPLAAEGTGDAATRGFADIAAAATYASAHDIDLIVQVGSGGDAEKQAVQKGTWAGWVKLLVAEFATRAPTITMWSPWNEPNTSYSELTGAQYARQVEIPFADAAHAANGKARVIAGNTLGFVDEWWADALTTPLCGKVDAIAVHPYTGWNRSWEEEGFSESGNGFDKFRTTLGSACSSLPIWDTESGWWADGQVAYWGQGSNVARKLLWYANENISGWTYFFSEGGWGESNLSWSLIQFGAYVKPGGLSFAAVSRMLGGTGTPKPVETSVPFTTVMSLPTSASTLVATWTSEANIDAVIRTGASEVTVTDQYGARRTVPVTDGSAAVTLTTGPQFVSAPAGQSVSIEAKQTYGDDLLKGQTVSASSTHKETDAQTITSGTVDPYRPWRSGTVDGEVDEHPTVEIPLARATTIDRIAVASGSTSCCEAGLRDYTVSVKTPDGSWKTVVEQKGQYWQRVVIFSFDEIEATAVKVEVPWTKIRDTKMLSVNYTGMAGGLPTPFMGLQTASDYVVAISAVSAWASSSSAGETP